MTPQELLEEWASSVAPSDEWMARFARKLFVKAFGGKIQIDDSGLASWIASQDGRSLSLRYNPVLGWFTWTRSRWAQVSEAFATEVVRVDCDMFNDALDALRSVEHDKCARIKSGWEHTEGCAEASVLVRQMRRYRNRAKINNLTMTLRHTTGVLVEDVSAFDSHPHLLNCPNGVLDLTDGTLREPDPAWLMTKQTGAAYDPEATHPDIDKVLEALSEMEPTTLEWFQRVLGSGCSGDQPSDDVNVINYGGGSNGKTTLLGAAMTALGDYAGTVPDSVWGGSADEVRKGLLSFRGKRLMYCEETPEEGKLPTETIKKLSGSKEVDARALYKGEVTFKASHTMLISTNHKPYVRETDKGTWRRLAMVPFTKIFEGTDSTIRSRVESGADGRAEAMLAWLVPGCMRWYADDRKLRPLPPEVQALTQSWRDSNDLVGMFLTEAIAFTSAGFVSKADLHFAFEAWCATQALASPYRSQRGFNSAMSAHEYAVAHRVSDARGPGGTKGWSGLALLAVPACVT